MRLVIGLLLLAFSGACLAAGLLIPDATPMLAVGGLGLVCALILLVRRSREAAPRWAILDGSNVMHWKDEAPNLAPVKEVLELLKARGYTAGVVFDANAGYKLSGKYRHDGALSKTLGLPKERVMVVNRGEPADPTILTAARDMGAIIITNDRFRDWADAFPEVKQPGHLIRGEYRDGKLRLDLPID